MTQRQKTRKKKKSDGAGFLTVAEQKSLLRLKSLGVVRGKRIGVVAEALGLQESKAYEMVSALMAKGKLQVEHQIKFTVVEA